MCISYRMSIVYRMFLARDRKRDKISHIASHNIVTTLYFLENVLMEKVQYCFSLWRSLLCFGVWAISNDSGFINLYLIEVYVTWYLTFTGFTPSTSPQKLNQYIIFKKFHGYGASLTAKLVRLGTKQSDWRILQFCNFSIPQDLLQYSYRHISSVYKIFYN